MINRSSRSVLVIATTLILSLSASRIAQASKAVTYQHPLAYIGWDGNVWVTDLNSGAGTAITKEGRIFGPDDGPDYSSGDPKSHFYSAIEWSPTDSLFSVDAEDFASGGDSVYVFRSSQQPVQLDNASQGM